MRPCRRRWAPFLNSRAALLLVLTLVLLEPFIYNIGLYLGWHGGYVAESSIFSLDKSKYFSELFQGQSVFFSGQHSVFVLSYFVWYALWSGVSTFLPDVTSYFVLIIAFYLLGFCFFIKLALYLTDTNVRDASLADLSVIGTMGLLYFSSLSMFNYIKSNVFFVLPYLILPALLYVTCSFLRTNDKRFLLPYLLLSLMLSDLNVTHALIIAVFVNVFLLLLARNDRLPAREVMKRLALIDVLLLPAFLFLSIVVVADALYSGGLSTFAKIATENMYSNNASYMNIFSQLTDWGLFGSWNGVRYYAFAPFYADSKMRVAAIAPYLLLGYALIVTQATRRRKAFALSLLVTLIVIFQLMLGNNNVVYHFLYTHFIVFQVFRNVTKLAPLLYFVLLIASFIFIRDRLSVRHHFLVVVALLVAALVYNIPYWSYQGYFFRDRAIRTIPPYWQEAANYINETSSPNSKILALPAIYINDVYLWEGRQAWVQGNLLDILVRNKSYRLSECCIGPPEFQFDARATFIPSTRSIRKLDTDYGRLSRLVNKYHLDYVVVSADLLSEYQDINDVKRWLSRSGYAKVATFGKITIYRNHKLFSPPLVGEHLSFQQLTNLSYRIRLRKVKTNRRIYLEVPFHRGWLLYPQVWPEENWCHPIEVVGGSRGVTQCKDAPVSLGADGIRHAFVRPESGFAHERDIRGFNEWTIDAEYIRRHYSRAYYSENADGSIDVQMELFFRPQAYFLILALAGLGSFAILLMYLGYSAVARYGAKASFSDRDQPDV